MLPMLVLNHLPEVHLRAPLSPLHKAFTVNPIGLQAHPQGTNLADNSLGGVECTAHHPGSGGMADIVSVTCNAPVEYRRPCSCYFPPESGLLRMTHRYINKGRNQSRLFVRERVELFIIELSGR